MKYNYDIVIVGVGIVGSSILYQLAKNGYKVLGIEQFEIPHDRGSSHGDKRIIRLAPFEGDIYYHMSKAVLPLWKEVEQSAKKQLYFPVGGLDIGHKDEDHFLTAARICKTFKLPYEILTSKQIRERHPAFSISSPDIRAVYQPGGGYILANESWKTFVELAKIYSAEIQTNVTVKDIQYNHNEAIVITENSEIISKKVIVTAGGWTSQLLPFFKIKTIYRKTIKWLV